MILTKKSLTKIKTSDADIKPQETIKFEVGNVYTNDINRSFAIKILKRTDRTVWFENIVDGETSFFASQGRKKVVARYGRETIIDGMHQYSATPIRR
jgi:hypothetical protein